MRAIQAHQSLEKKHKDREEARLRGKRSGCTDQEGKDIESFLPPPEDGRDSFTFNTCSQSPLSLSFMV